MQNPPKQTFQIELSREEIKEVKAGTIKQIRREIVPQPKAKPKPKHVTKFNRLPTTPVWLDGDNTILFPYGRPTDELKNEELPGLTLRIKWLEPEQQDGKWYWIIQLLILSPVLV